MPYIRVDVQKMQNTSDTLLDISKKVDEIENLFSAVSRRLDWDVRNEQDIEHRLESISRELVEEERMLRRMIGCLNNAIDKYTDLDRKSKNSENQTNKNKNAIILANNVAVFQCDLLKRIKNLFKGYGKLKHDDTSEFTADILEYVHDFIQLYSGGNGKEPGIVRWLNLADSSCGLWKGFYEILKDGFKEETIKRLFENKLGDIADVIGMTGAFAGFLGSYIQFSKTGTMEDFQDMAKSIVGVGKEIYLAEVHPDSSYSAHTYTSIIKSGIDFTVQVGESVKKYSQDGEWSMRDTGATGVEASIAGLNTLISGYTFGIVSLETIGTSPEEVSKVALTGADNWGKKAGEMIRNDPELKKEYDEASSLKKTRMLLWAIGKTGYMTLKS